MSKKNKKPSIEVDYTGLTILIVLVALTMIGLIIFIKSDYAERKAEVNQTNTIKICDEIDNISSKYVKHIGDMVYINGKNYKYLDIKIRCELKSYQNIKEFENQSK